MKRFILSHLFFLLLLASVSYGQDLNDVYLGQPVVRGSGCPRGTVSATLSPDKKTLSILFDRWQAITSPQQLFVRKSCNVAIPVHVPSGFSVSLFKYDYRGYAYVPQGGRGNFRVEYFFAGSQGPVVSRNFNPTFDRDFIATDNVLGVAASFSRCGEDVILRSNASLRATKRRANAEDVIMMIDSQDVQQRLLYQLQWRRCG